MADLIFEPLDERLQAVLGEPLLSVWRDEVLRRAVEDLAEAHVPVGVVEIVLEKIVMAQKRDSTK